MTSEHGHAHGLVDRSIVRSRAGVRAVLSSLAVLTVAAGVQVAIFVLTDSVALLADLNVSGRAEGQIAIHVGADALDPADLLPHS